MGGWTHLVEHARVALVACDRDGRVLRATPYAARLLGADPAGHPLAGLVAPQSRPGLAARLAELILASDAGDSVFGTLTTAGSPARVLEFEGSRLPGAGEAVSALVLHDVTQHHEREAALRREMAIDALTGLANRRVFNERLAQLSRSEVPGHVAVLDLDHFKRVNDEHGHQAGDRVLVEFARRLRSVVGEDAGATVARVGGEEFGVLLPGCASEDAAALIRRALAAIAEPHPGIGVVTASAGMAAVGRAGSRRAAGTRAADAFRAADEALYVAKASGRARLIVHGDEATAARRSIDETIDALKRLSAELAEEARTDALTAVGNRRRFDEDLAAVAAAAARRESPYAVLFIDLDEFGLVNKAWTEEAGNDTLAAAASVIAGAVRAGDALYRYGGEEFAAILPDATRDGALGVCRRIREALAARRIPHPTRERITASMGAASSADHGDDPAAVVRAAIAGMRRAKEDGRDTVVAP